VQLGRDRLRLKHFNKTASPGLTRGVHVFRVNDWEEDVDGRDKPGQDVNEAIQSKQIML
jgi:hypothetical protein